MNTMQPEHRTGKTTNRMAFLLAVVAIGFLAGVAVLFLTTPSLPKSTPSPSADGSSVPRVSDDGGMRSPAKSGTGAAGTSRTANNSARSAAGDTASATDSSGRYAAAIDRMRSALDAGDAEQSLRLARQLMSATDPDVRRQALDQFCWIGSAAFPEVTAMIRDPSPDVSQRALDGWADLLRDVTNHTETVAIVTSVISALSNPDDRQKVMMTVSLFPDLVAAQYYADMLGSKDESVVALAREYLLAITKEPVLTQADAFRWIAARAKQESEKP